MVATWAEKLTYFLNEGTVNYTTVVLWIYLAEKSSNRGMVDLSKGRSSYYLRCCHIIV